MMFTEMAAQLYWIVVVSLGLAGFGESAYAEKATDIPTLFVCGDSTAKNSGRGNNGEPLLGWGTSIAEFFDANQITVKNLGHAGTSSRSYFDPEKINVVNRAFGGTSSRTVYRDFFWRNLKPLIRKGDFALLQFGANNNGGARGKGALRGAGDETETVETNGQTETVHTFGWYLRRFVGEIRERGATPIICSLTSREGGPPKENLHTGWDGAVINAGCVIAGLKGLRDNPLAPFFSARAEALLRDGSGLK